MATATAFHTPPRILIPKLVRSRDAWKAKAAARKAEQKALTIRVRDLVASRQRHRQRAEDLQQRVDHLQQRVDHLEQEVARYRPDGADAGDVAPPKKICPPAAANTPSPSSVSP